MLAQVGSAQLVAEGVGRSLRWGGSRRCRGSGLRPARAEVVASYTASTTPLCRLDSCWHDPNQAWWLCACAGSPPLVLLKTTLPLPCLACCRASSPGRPAEPQASEDEYEYLPALEAAATVCIPVSVAVSLSDGQPQKHNLRSGTRV